MTNFAYNFAGAGAVVADSVTTTGPVLAGTTLTAGTTVNAGTGVNLTAGQFLGPAGTVGAPTYSYAGDPNTGHFNVGGDQIGSVGAGINQLTVANGAITASAALVVNAATYSGGSITPTALAVNTDNYAPTGYATTGLIILSASAPVDLTGFAAVANITFWIVNNSANTITLKHDVTSTAANRFYCPGAVDFALTQNKIVRCQYVGSLAAGVGRWLLGGAG